MLFSILYYGFPVLHYLDQPIGLKMFKCLMIVFVLSSELSMQRLAMASVKTWCLLPLAALLLLSVVPTVAEVVQSMSDCKGFLHNETPPRVPGILENGNILDQNRYKPICQTLDNVRRFVTLYDTKNRIPVFSAYKYKGKNGCRPTTKWMTEPQVCTKLETMYLLL